jgi:hypothetical protein
VPPPPTSPERRLPLRQLPSERSFSASPRNVDPVRNDWVFPLLKSGIFTDTAVIVSLSADDFCHSHGDEFCLFESISGVLTSRFHDE